MEAALLRFVIYFFALANFACSLEHAKRTRSCAQFPTHMQLFCYRVEKFWGSIAFPDPRNTVEDVQEVDRNNVVVGNVVQNNKLKDTGCAVENCQSCPGTAECSKCQYGYFRQIDSEKEVFVCVRKCFAGYKRTIDQSGIATCEEVRPKCNIPRCGNCLDSQTCSECEKGSYQQFHSDAERNICVKRCFFGYALKTDATGKQSCQLKLPSAACQDLKCRTCRIGYYMQPRKISGKVCLRNCPKGYLKDKIRRRCIDWPW